MHGWMDRRRPSGGTVIGRKCSPSEQERMRRECAVVCTGDAANVLSPKLT